ncbi:glycoside hydrolase family 16 protein [Tulasnella calospora MUT 4182]|uniref:Glycoside hydrolase family 16 protein n=1 Tax=Tulasnella calospora MUT 4182 TaxID=1051891 RepID=A0A0C3QT10_9AGAM|nr:glycoside hydrolase family 16 protein [Tulasnella calospora MUT 4182]
MLAPRAPELKSKSSDSSLRTVPSLGASIADKYSLDYFTTIGAQSGPEPDDFIHNPDPRRDRKNDRGGTIFTQRGVANLGCLIFLTVGLVALFAGYPVVTYILNHPMTTLGAYNLGGTNGSGQVPTMTGNWDLIDKDTPQEVYTVTSYQDGSEYELVFSDEFNQDGRTFYPGDDPYWEAVDLHYWGTKDLEWYDPEQITTKDGNLVITLDDKPRDNLNYTGGMMSTWNKFCFTGGLIMMNASMPGSSSAGGLWPAVWTMGNLGRAGYGASLDGMWPYSYDECDVGTLPNQTRADGTPDAAATGGWEGEPLSYLPGQRLSACTCSEDDALHPGPIKSDGTYKGRSAPEIDIVEMQVEKGEAHASMSAQFAPYNAKYIWDNSSTNAIFHSDLFELNSYRGGIWQMTTSGVGNIDQGCFELIDGCYKTYGFDYKPGNDGYITWVYDDAAAWTVMATGLGPDLDTEIGQRPIPEEPMYIIANLGISNGFSPVEKDKLIFPAHFKIDWIRVYQPKDSKNVGCDPDGFPTTAYINQYLEAYTNPNLTTWIDDYGQRFPKNQLLDNCK